MQAARLLFYYCRVGEHQEEIFNIYQIVSKISKSNDELLFTQVLRGMPAKRIAISNFHFEEEETMKVLEDPDNHLLHQRQIEYFHCNHDFVFFLRKTLFL